jgi:hypothetical protein
MSSPNFSRGEKSSTVLGKHTLQPRARSLVTARIDVFVIDKSSNKPVRDARSLLSRSIKSEHGGQIQTLAICGMSSSVPAELMGIGRYR